MKEEELEQAQHYLRTRVTGIIEKMTVDLMLHKPDDTVAFMINWLEQKGPDVEKDFMRKVRNRPEGVDTSESSDDEEEEVFELPKKKTIPQKQRKSVSGEVYGVYNPKGNFKSKVIPKSEEVKSKIRMLLSNIFMFKHFDEKEMDIILDAVEVKNFNSMDMVIKQGDDGYELYIVGSGKLKCYKRFPDKTEDTYLKTYEAGEVFGELSLLYNAPRAASIQAIEPATLYSLDRETFNHIVKQSATENRNKYEEFLSQVEVLQTLDKYERSKLCDCLKILTFEPNQRIITEGEKGNTFYLIIEGQAVALKRNPNTGFEEEVYQYNEKMYFGELSLIRDQPRAASIVAKTNIKVASIERNAFKRILGSLEDILKRNAEKYKKFITNK